MPRSSEPAVRCAFNEGVENANESVSTATPARIPSILDVCNGKELRIIWSQNAAMEPVA